ncbi:hypothetical protein [Sorangium sp. So ce1000]|uniref:hypothetical protein n=1 Tax=Sorangium sp. So ce1000 TaxID=3133325 RepID=UPI003F5E4D7E
MRGTQTAVMSLMLLVGAGPAGAQPQEAKPGGGRIAPLLPTLRLEGSTDGSATLEVGADLIVRASDSIDLSIAPSLALTTADGLAALFSSDELDQAGAMPLRGGGTVSLFYLGEPVARTSVPALRAADLRMKSIAVARCKEVCEQRPGDSSCVSFNEELKKVISEASLDVGDLCQDGRALWIEYESHTARELRGMYPDLVLSARAVVGRDSFTYMAVDPGQTNLTLHRDERHTTVDFGTSLSWITSQEVAWGSKLTLEALFRVTTGYEPSRLKAAWCTPGGSVPRTDGSGVDEAELCTSRTYGAPMSSTRMRGALRVGVLNRLQDQWRFALGPYVVRDGDSYAVGVEAPLYFNFASAPPEYAGSYKGLIGLAPRAEWSVRGDGFPESRFLLSLQLLGQRSFFGGAFD